MDFNTYCLKGEVAGNFFGFEVKIKTTEEDIMKATSILLSTLEKKEKNIDYDEFPLFKST